MIGSSGIILTVDSARWIAPGVDELPTNTPDGFTGLFLDGAKVEFAALGIGDVTMDDVFIGTSGFSGTVGWEDPDLTWNPAGGSDGSGAFEGVLALELAGFDGGLSKFAVEFRQSALVGCEIAGCIYAPYIERVIGLDIGLDGDGSFTAIAEPPTCKFTNDDPAAAAGARQRRLHPLRRHRGRLQVRRQPGRGACGRRRSCVVGAVGPRQALTSIVRLARRRVQGLEHRHAGPCRDRRRLARRRSGEERTAVSGFPLQITRIGFGVEKDGRAWVGLNGGIKLHDILPVGASIEGLKVSWKDGRADELLARRHRCRARRRRDVSASSARPRSSRPTRRAASAATIKLSLDSVGLAIDVGIMVGRMNDGTFFFYLYIGVDLPVGIPLFSTGAAIYGFAGLLAVNLQPARVADEHWYYGYYKRSPVGVTPPEKWAVKRDAFAVGVGTTIGSMPDTGYAISAKVLLILSLPGPRILLQARAASSRRSRTTRTRQGGHVRSPAGARHAGQAVPGQSGHHLQDGHAARDRRRRRRRLLVGRSSSPGRVARLCRREGAGRAACPRQAARSPEGRHVADDQPRPLHGVARRAGRSSASATSRSAAPCRSASTTTSPSPRSGSRLGVRAGRDHVGAADISWPKPSCTVRPGSPRSAWRSGRAQTRRRWPRHPSRCTSAPSIEVEVRVNLIFFKWEFHERLTIEYTQPDLPDYVRDFVEIKADHLKASEARDLAGRRVPPDVRPVIIFSKPVRDLPWFEAPGDPDLPVEDLHAREVSYQLRHVVLLANDGTDAAPNWRLVSAAGRATVNGANVEFLGIGDVAANERLPDLTGAELRLFSVGDKTGQTFVLNAGGGDTATLTGSAPQGELCYRLSPPRGTANVSITNVADAGFGQVEVTLLDALANPQRFRGGALTSAGTKWDIVDATATTVRLQANGGAAPAAGAATLAGPDPAQLEGAWQAAGEPVEGAGSSTRLQVWAPHAVRDVPLQRARYDLGSRRVRSRLCLRSRRRLNNRCARDSKICPSARSPPRFSRPASAAPTMAR